MKPSKPRRIRRRTRNEGSETRPRKVTIRMTERLSNELASMQGLVCHVTGKPMNMAEVFERNIMPFLRIYVKPYAERAKAKRSKRLHSPTGGRDGKGHSESPEATVANPVHGTRSQ